MNGNLTQPLLSDAQDMQGIIAQALKAMPKPAMPSWMETLAAFVRLHPWISLLVFLAVVLVISAVVREIICSYLKTSEILVRLKRLEEKIDGAEKK